MHEYAAMERIVRTCASAAADHGKTRVTGIRLVVGDQSGIVPASCRMYFAHISRGTPCEGAALTFEPVAAKLRCAACGTLFERVPFRFDCPTCGGEGEPTDIGREFHIKEIEAE